MADRTLIDALNHSLAVGGVDGYEGPTEAPRTPHESHPINVAGRCAACGARASWAAIEKKCRGDRVEREDVSFDEASTLIPMYAGRFFEWWRDKDFDEGLPTIEEWAWNFAEWMARGRE